MAAGMGTKPLRRKTGEQEKVILWCRTPQFLP